MECDIERTGEGERDRKVMKERYEGVNQGKIK